MSEVPFQLKPVNSFEYVAGDIIRKACDVEMVGHMPRFFLTCSVGELAQRVARALPAPLSSPGDTPEVPYHEILVGPGSDNYGEGFPPMSAEEMMERSDKTFTPEQRGEFIKRYNRWHHIGETPEPGKAAEIVQGLKTLLSSAQPDFMEGRAIVRRAIAFLERG